MATIFRRFLNNTILSTVINNTKGKTRKTPGNSLTREDKALFKASEKFKAKEKVVDPVKKVVPETSAAARKGKVVIKTGSRYSEFLSRLTL